MLACNPLSICRSLGVLCLAVIALALSGCASLKVTPQNYQVVQSPVTVSMDAGSDVVPNTATASIDGQPITMSCTQYACTSTQSVDWLQAGIHTILASVQETCATCNPNPITLNNDATPNNPPTPPPHPETQFVVDYALNLSPVQLSVQQGQSASLVLTDTPVLNLSSNLVATGVPGVSISPTQVGAATISTGLTLSVGASVPPGNYTLTIQQKPVDSHVPTRSAVVNLTVAAVPSNTQTGAFVQAAFTCSQITSPDGQLVAKCGPAQTPPPNAPNAANAAQFFTAPPANQVQGSAIGFYAGGGAAFCPASNYGAVMTPVPTGSNLGTNAQVIFYIKALPSVQSNLTDYVAYTNGNGTNVSGQASLWFSPGCNVVMVEDVDPSVPAGSRPLRAQFYKSGLISPFYTVHYNSNVSASVISGGLNGEVQVTADNGNPTTSPIP